MTEPRVCLMCSHKHTTDLSWPTASPCADHAWTDARKLLSGDYRLTVLPEPPPVTWDSVVEAANKIRQRGFAPRTEPIKLTPGQWAILPHGDPRMWRCHCGQHWVSRGRIEPLWPGLMAWRRESHRERRRRLGLKWWQR